MHAVQHTVLHFAITPLLSLLCIKLLLHNEETQCELSFYAGVTY